MSEIISGSKALDVATDAEVVASVAQYFENLASADAYPDRPRPRFRRRLSERLREIARRSAATPPTEERSET